mmetsp:Transcript_27147/g.67288  ORF Transcript_27147/g.67288 Transcript_27147/m.67288 type:complete len:197 (-) Transcript_27147:304-894(-)
MMKSLHMNILSLQGMTCHGFPSNIGANAAEDENGGIQRAQAACRVKVAKATPLHSSTVRDYVHARCSRRGRRELDESSEHHVVSNLTTTTPDRAPSRRCGARRKFEKHHAPGTQASQLLPCPALPPSNAVASKVATSRQISARKSNCSKASIEAATSRTPSARWPSSLANTHDRVVRRPMRSCEQLDRLSEAVLPI